MYAFVRFSPRNAACLCWRKYVSNWQGDWSDFNREGRRGEWNNNEARDWHQRPRNNWPDGGRKLPHQSAYEGFSGRAAPVRDWPNKSWSNNRGNFSGGSNWSVPKRGCPSFSDRQGAGSRRGEWNNNETRDWPLKSEKESISSGWNNQRPPTIDWPDSGVSRRKFPHQTPYESFTGRVRDSPNRSWSNNKRSFFEENDWYHRSERRVPERGWTPPSRDRVTSARESSTGEKDDVVKEAVENEEGNGESGNYMQVIQNGRGGWKIAPASTNTSSKNDGNIMDEESIAAQQNIRKSLEDIEQDETLLFHRSDGRLPDIRGDMEEEWQPAAMDEQLIFEMSNLFKQGNVAPWEAEDIVRTNGGLLRPYHVFEVLNNCGNNADLALGFFRWASIQPLYQHVIATYNTILKLLGQHGKVESMKQVVKDMENCQVSKSQITYRLLFRSFVGANSLEDALEVFDEMEKSETPPHPKEYMVLIDKLLKDECYRVVPVLFRNYKAAGNIPDAYIYNAVISSLCNVAKVNEAREICGEMKEACGCDVHTYAILIDGYVKCHKVASATEVFREMLDRGCIPGEDIFNLLFGLHARAGELEQAVDLFRKVVEQGCQPTVKSYGMLLDTFVRVDKLDKAYEFFKELTDKGVYPSMISYNALLNKLSKSGKTSYALKLFEEIKGLPQKPNVITYNTAIELLVKIGRVEEAWNTFLELKASSYSPDLITYNTLMVRLGKAGRLEQCFQLLDDMKQRCISPNQTTYTGLIEALARYGQVEPALQLLHEMKSLGYAPNVTTMQILIRNLWTSGNLEEAKKLVAHNPGIYSLRLEGRPWNMSFPDPTPLQQIGCV